MLNIALYFVIHLNSPRFYEPSLFLVSLAVIILDFTTSEREKERKLCITNWHIKTGSRILKILALSLGAVLVTAQAYSIEMIELEKSHLLTSSTLQVWYKGQSRWLFSNYRETILMRGTG